MLTVDEHQKYSYLLFKLRLRYPSSNFQQIIWAAKMFAQPGGSESLASLSDKTVLGYLEKYYMRCK